MMSDASEMLAAALEQMDGIIAGSKAMDYSNGLFDCQSPASPFLGGVRVVHLLEDLRGAVELMETEERDSLRAQVPVSTAEGLVEWLQGRLTNGHGSVAGDLVYQERLARVESDKECLVLQVSVLTDQVEVQGEKIKDLEMCLEEHRMKLNATEELLQQELLSRSTLETQKLELLTEISSLKLKLATVDRDNRESEGLNEELGEMRLRVAAAETETLQHERNLRSTKEELMVLQRELELRRLREQSGPEVMSSDAVQSREKDLEVQRLKQAVESLMVSNHEKDCKIEEFQQTLMRYRKVQDMVIAVQKDRAKEEDTRVGLGEGSTTVSEASNTENVLLGGTEETDEPQVIPCAELAPEFELPNTSQSKPIDELQPILITHGSQVEVPMSEVSAPPISSDEAETEEEVGKKSSSPAVSPSQVSPAGNESFGTRKSRSSFGRGFFKIRSGKRTASAPDLAESERKRTEHLDLAEVPRPKPEEGDLSSPETKKKAKGIRRFLGMMKRSQSTSFNLEEAESEFKRGGVRATAGPRLGWSRDMQQSNNNELITPFAHWSKEQVFAWLQQQGLGLYISQAQHWIRSGQTLLNASPHELEKELGIRHPLHRKKLHLAIQALGTEEDAMGKLDFNWVTRWLDDIGLPQYKSQFDEGRVDGRMLHYMTVDDLLSLKVGSVLHHLSIKRAIQVLRINHYEPSCLRRRPSDENNMAPIQICQWTNHRVMEWLRSVDLAEYAPNLRGSGVHGGLMVLEPRFNVETMALLLNIPPNKSLLRRHLATHFHLLIGAEAQRLKQECLENPDYSPLTATARVKPRRLSFGGFGTLRRKRQEENEEFVCPMDVQMPQSRSFHGGLCIYGDNLDQLEQMDDSEGTVRQIGVFSEGINNLTSMLKEDEFFKEASSCSHDAGTAENESSA